MVADSLDFSMADALTRAQEFAPDRGPSSVDAAAFDGTDGHGATSAMDAMVHRDDGVTLMDARPPLSRDGSPPEADSDASMDVPDAQSGPPSAALPLDQITLLASHNSYSGGARRSIWAQLEGGVRFLELDVHDDDFDAEDDFRIGHLWVGEAVSTEGENPDTALLGPWLEQIAQWSRAHVDHSPLILVLDLKDNLVDNPGPEHGNLGALNARLEGIFGDALLPASEMVGPWAPVDALRGRILVVLSGNRGNRTAYGTDHGVTPAVAVNGRGQVVEVHDSGGGTLWFWTGQRRPDGHVDWHHHGRYATGRRPAVLLTDDGVIVAVHQGALLGRLFATVGRLAPDGTVGWGPSVEYDRGVTPTLGLDEDGRIEEIHRSQFSGDRWRWTFEIVDDAIEFSGHGRTDDPLYPVHLGGPVRVFVEGGAGGLPGPLRYASETVDSAPIRYRSVAFVEAQPGDPDALAEAARFRAAPAGHEGFVRRPGVIARWWGVAEAHVENAAGIHAPATDTPFEPWYRQLTAGAVR